MRNINGESRENGSITILLAVVIMGIIGIAAFALDLGYGLVVKSELQNAADTGALAGDRELALVYKDMGTTCTMGPDCYWGTHTLSSGEKARIATKVNSYSQLNKAGGTAITVRTTEDIVYGKYDEVSGEVVPTTPADTGVMAIKVTARRDENINGVVSTWLGRAIGTDSLSISAKSGATLSALGKAPPGKLGIPVGISEFFFKADNSPCGKAGDPEYRIRLYPTQSMAEKTIGDTQACAGWHSYQDYPNNAAKLKTILDGQAKGTFTSPETIANSTSYNFIGGAVATAFNEMKQLYEVNKDSNQTWTAVIPVYAGKDCSNPNGPIKIVGFATAYIYSVDPAAKSIFATVTCNVIDWGEGGGTDYGTLVGRPGMVQ